MAAKRQQRKYTDAQKAAFLAAVDGFATHLSINAAIDKVVESYPGDISKQTLFCWVKGRGISADVPEMRQKKTEAIADLCDDVVRQSLAMMGVRSEDAEYKDLAIGVGILVEKSQLLRQMPTAISENRSEQTDEQLRAELAGLLAGCSAPSGNRNRKAPLSPTPQTTVN